MQAGRLAGTWDMGHGTEDRDKHGEEHGLGGDYLVYYCVHTCLCEVYGAFLVVYKSD